MTERGDEVRTLLKDAAGSGREREVRPEDTWSRGRRRRSHRRAGAGAVGVLGVAAVVGLVWQAGLFGGGQEVGVATLPPGMTTFVLAAPDAPGKVPDSLEGVTVPAPEELAGTAWVLRDELWGTDQTSGDMVGSGAETTVSFAGQDSRGWGFGADDCGGGWFQEDLTLGADGAFPAGDLATDDQGCPEPAQTSEDFWIDVLRHGGSLHLLGDDWLLLSVDTSWAGVEEPPPVLDDSAARLDFAREGVDPATVDTSLPERVPTNEELAGNWQLLDWADGGGVLGDLVGDPSQLRLSFEGMPPESMVLSDGPPAPSGRGQTCPIVTLSGLQGVDAFGHTVPPDDGYVLTADGACATVMEVQPVLVEALRDGAQITLVGEDLLVLRIPLPARGVAEDPGDASDPTDAPAEPLPADPTDGPPAGAVVDPGTEVAWPDAESWNVERPGAIVTGVRFGAHDGFDRVVIDLEADTQPGWMIRYETPAGGQAFGPIDLPGEGVLVLDVLGGSPHPVDPAQPAPVPVGESAGTVFTDALVGGPYEGHMNLFIGVDRERPFSVAYLEEPSRLVIDIQH